MRTLASRLSLPIALLLVTACGTGISRRNPDAPGSGGGATPAAAEDRLLTLEARLIGLTSEVDRLSRRIAALDGGGALSRRPAETPREPSSREEAPPPAEESRGPEDPALDAVIERMRAEAPKKWTGILIDVRPLGEAGPEGRGYGTWQVVDPEGAPIFTSDDLPRDLRRTHPVFWLAPEGSRLGPEALPVLGRTPFSTDATAAEAVGGREARITVDAKAAETLRKLENLDLLLRAGNVAILLRKTE